ncbi:DUF2920 family protein [Aeribacillus sp. FSL M8-0235]|uniref:DUF2920 family protein n=1 Tax=Aeribacillus sp. FSL M8-0235 TaxID=2954576 RepID=UPI0030F8DE28
MAKNHQLKIPAHPSIYTGNNIGRQLNIYFSEPETGVNEDTGLLILILGFGANSQSNVYKKMRQQFADQYNLITIQCDYFGSEFMQDSKRVKLNFSLTDFKDVIEDIDLMKLKSIQNFEEFITIFAKYPISLPFHELLDENIENFNDMGFMQALDLLTALFAVKIILNDNQLKYNVNKVIAYGHSHGAYLAYLCNRMAPNEFTFIIDNSAWMKPEYLYTNRFLHKYYGKLTLNIEFSYLAKELVKDKNILTLSNLYKGFINNAQIYSFLGTDDNLVSIKEKENFCKGLGQTNFYLIDQSKVDHKIFHSTTHGLNADFLEMFKFVMEQVQWDKKEKHKRNPNTIINSHQFEYRVDFDKGLPVMTVKKL